MLLGALTATSTSSAQVLLPDQVPKAMVGHYTFDENKVLDSQSLFVQSLIWEHC